MSTTIKSFEAEQIRKQPWAIKVAHKLSTSFGSTSFLIFSILFFTSWITINLGLIPKIPIFDPYPFVLLITTVSIEAIILTIIVLMSQNRQNYVSSLREEIDFQINLIAEKEITKALKLLIKIAEKQGVVISDKELKEIIEDVEVSYIERRLKEQIQKEESTLVEKLTQPFKKDVKD